MSVDIEALAAELLAGHPVTGVYDADAQLAADQLNALNRTRNRTSMTGSEVLNAVVKSEYVALTDANKDRMWQVLHLGDLDPFGVEADLLIDIFGGGSGTITALASARKVDISRADELGFRTVRSGEVIEARA